MSRVKKLHRKLTRTEKSSRIDRHLEIKIREGTSETDVAAIVKALATISNFFGVRLVRGGGSGGKPHIRFRSMAVTRPKMAHPRRIRPELEIPSAPVPSPEHRVKGTL